MTHQAPPCPTPDTNPGRQLAQLREVLRLVERLAGRTGATEAWLDEAARVSAGYDHALPIVQRRFDALAAETAGWAAAGVEALLAAGQHAPPAAAAARLADRLDRAIRDLTALLD